MTGTVTRRTAIAGAAVAPVLPAGAAAAAGDPFPAYARWITAVKAEQAYRTPRGVEWHDDPEAMRLDREFRQASWEIINNAPPTAEGMLAPAHVALHCSGPGDWTGADPDRPEAYPVDCGHFADDRDTHAMRALVRHLQALVGDGSGAT